MKHITLITALMATTPAMADNPNPIFPEGPDPTMTAVANAVEDLAAEKGVAIYELETPHIGSLGDALRIHGGIEGVERAGFKRGVGSAFRHPDGGMITVESVSGGYKVTLTGMSPKTCARIRTEPSHFKKRITETWTRPGVEEVTRKIWDEDERVWKSMAPAEITPDMSRQDQLGLVDSCIGVDEITVIHRVPQ